MSIYDTGPRRDELIARLRNEMNLTKEHCTDEDLLKGTKDTFVFARIELGMSWSQFWKDLKSSITL